MSQGFETDEYFGFVVSDLGQNEILRLAAALAPPLRDALNKSTGTERSATPGFQVDSVSIRLKSACAARRWHGQREPELRGWQGYGVEAAGFSTGEGAPRP